MKIQSLILILSLSFTFFSCDKCRNKSSIATVNIKLSRQKHPKSEVANLKFNKYPRIANLWGFGYNLSAGDYDYWAKHDLLVCQNWRWVSDEEKIKFIKELRKRNPDIILIDTAPLMNINRNSPDTVGLKEEWYLHRPDGKRISWWAGSINVPNLLNEQCLDFLVEKTVKWLGMLIDEKLLDGIYYDTVVSWVYEFLGPVVTDDGQTLTGKELNTRWQAAQNSFLDKVRKRFPNVIIMANDIDGGHMKHANGRNFEGGTLLNRLPNKRISPEIVADSLSVWMKESLQPAVTFACMDHPTGWQSWREGSANFTMEEMERIKNDFQRMRVGLITTLMSDAYYSYEIGTVGHGQPWWYAEYDAPLGAPLSPGISTDEGGIKYLFREFEGGIALLNSSSYPVKFKFNRKLKLIKDDAAPRFEIEADDMDKDFLYSKNWITKDINRYNYGKTYRLSTAPDAIASWAFTIPIDDTYTVYALTPKQESDTFCSDAEYNIRLPKGKKMSVKIDQQKGMGGWQKLFDIKLKQGETYRLELKSGAMGNAVADAIKLESKTRFNDGTETDEVMLNPLDGVIMLNK